MGRDYDKLARDCNLSKRFLKNITSSERNENILRWLRDDDLYALSIGEGDTDYSEFIVREGDDLGWLGFYIGKCRTLEALHIFDMPGDIDQINEFLRELSRNQSLQELCINTDLVDAITEKFGEFFRHNKSLYELDLRYFDIGRESAHKLALTLCDTSLKSLSLTGNGLCKEGFTEIVTVVSAQTHIENLTVRSNNVGRIGCTALGTLLGSRALTLKDLDLGFNGIHNESLQLLAAGLTNNTTLEVLSLCGNTSVTGGGLRSLIPCLQSDRCSLVMLFFYHMHIGDEGAAAFAQGLSKNKTLTHLWFDPSDCGMTSTGWQSFVTLLCDTTSINNTYLSNHTLELIGESCDKGSPTDDVHDRVRKLLRMRKITNSEEAAISKIFQSHPDLDMKPFFTGGLRFLPLVVTWFEKVRSYRIFGRRMLERRQLSAVYQFVCGMPLLVIEGYQSLSGRKRKFIDT